MTDSGLRRLAAALARHAGRMLPKARGQWAAAMEHEVGHIAGDAEALRWAFGCVIASYKERITAMGIRYADPGPTIASPDADPFLWLEEIDGARVLAWVEEQNAATLARFGDASFAADRDALAAVMGRTDRLPRVIRYGTRLFDFWTDATHPHGIWRTTSLDSFRTDAPDWDVLLDLDALAATEGEDWIWKGASVLPGSFDRAILKLSRGNTDAVVLREFDLTARAFVPGGFHLPESKSWSNWLDRDTLLLMSPLGDGMATHKGLSRTVRRWHRGTDPLAAPVIFETGPESLDVWADVDREAEGESLVFLERRAPVDESGWAGDRDGPKVPWGIPKDTRGHWSRGWMVVIPQSAWTVGGETYEADTVMGISLAAYRAGDRRFTRLWEPGPSRAFHERQWAAGRLLLLSIDDRETVIDILTPSESGWARERVTGLPEQGAMSICRLDVQEEDSNGDFLVHIQNALTPPSLFLLSPGRAPELISQAPRTFDAAGLAYSYHETASTDGTRIPYIQVGPKAATGDAPVHLYGYGAFGISQVPGSAAIGKLWLQRGGTCVVAQIRGGGEFGLTWRDAGRGKGKRLAQDDFAAVAADLVRRGVTRSERIAGESQGPGGMLIANMLTRYPERLGALVCSKPIIDMRRYSKFRGKAGASPEFGDPDKPEDWAFLAPMSAYHAAVPGRSYPPILLAVNRHDRNFHPAHARKMAAKLQAMGYDAWYYEVAAAEPGDATEPDRNATFVALGFAFLRRKIGWDA